MTEDQKREELREKIEAGERRNQERSLGDYARDAADEATSFVKRHPIATVAGAVAVGAVVAAMVPGPGRRLRKKAAKQGSHLATMLTELGVAYGGSLLEGLADAGRSGQDRLEDLGETLGDTARGLRKQAGHLSSDAGDAARAFTRDAGKKAGRTLRDLRSRMSH
jgi:ElaB/YqjD/DUF883 family membrane-anchored ribosome-binding protein